MTNHPSRSRRIVAVSDTDDVGNLGVVHRYIASAPTARAEAERQATSLNRACRYPRYAVREMTDPSRLLRRRG